MGTVNKPDIVKQTIVINDDYVRKNRRADGKIGLVMGYADTNNKRIIINKFTVDKNAKLLNDFDVADISHRINSVDESDIVAHESQHIHNGAIGYNYIANSDNIYECMMLSLADEMSAMLAGYLHKYKNVDNALADVFKNLSGVIRQHYITCQFQNHFNHLQKLYGTDKDLYEHKFDSKKINKILKHYFTIDGIQVMDTMSKESKIKFGQFMIDIKSDIKNHIDRYVAQQKSASHMISGNNKGYSY